MYATFFKLISPSDSISRVFFSLSYSPVFNVPCCMYIEPNIPSYFVIVNAVSLTHFTMLVMALLNESTHDGCRFFILIIILNVFFIFSSIQWKRGVVHSYFSTILCVLKQTFLAAQQYKATTEKNERRKTLFSYSILILSDLLCVFFGFLSSNKFPAFL